MQIINWMLKCIAECPSREPYSIRIGPGVEPHDNGAAGTPAPHPGQDKPQPTCTLRGTTAKCQKNNRSVEDWHCGIPTLQYLPGQQLQSHYHLRMFHRLTVVHIHPAAACSNHMEYELKVRWHLQCWQCHFTKCCQRPTTSCSRHNMEVVAHPQHNQRRL